MSMNQAKTEEILLLYPPATQCRSPHLALPLLSSFLRENEIGCDIRDLNIECLHYFFTPERLKTAIERILLRRSITKDQDFKSRSDIASLYWSILDESLVTSLQLLCDRNSQLPKESELQRANTVLRLAYQLVSTEFHPTQWQEESFVMGFDSSNVKELMQATCAVDENPFLEFFSDFSFIHSLNLHDRKLIGISLCYQSQIIAGITLAKVIRKVVGSDVPIVLGGSIAMFLRNDTHAIEPFFDLVDAIVYGEGELPMVELIKAARDGRPFDDLPSLLIRRNGVVVTTDYQIGPHLSQLPTPDFGQFPLHMYLSNHLELPVMSERGCYFGTCAFCCVDLSPNRRFDSSRTNHLLDHIEKLSHNFGATHFLFITTALPAKKAKMISEALLERNLRIKWGSNIRYEDKFTQDILNVMHQSGCIVLNVGLESGSEKMVALMQKGFTIEQARNFHNRAKMANIQLGLYVMLGFPGETEQDRDETFNFLTEMELGLDDISLGQFSLNEFAPIYNEPETYNIEILERDNSLSFERNFNASSGEGIHTDLVTPFKKRFRIPTNGQTKYNGLNPKSILKLSKEIMIQETESSKFIALTTIDGELFDLNAIECQLLEHVDNDFSIQEISEKINIPLRDALDAAKTIYNNDLAVIKDFMHV